MIINILLSDILTQVSLLQPRFQFLNPPLSPLAPELCHPEKLNFFWLIVQLGFQGTNASNHNLLTFPSPSQHSSFEQLDPESKTWKTVGNTRIPHPCSVQDFLRTDLKVKLCCRVARTSLRFFAGSITAEFVEARSQGEEWEGGQGCSRAGSRGDGGFGH